MKFLPGISVILLLAGVGSGLSALEPAPYQFYGGEQYSSFEQSHDKAEFSWSRLRGTTGRYGGGGGGGGFGYGYGSWSRDYPKADRQFLVALKRLTRINGRSTEQVVDLDSDDIYNYPWVYAVQVQTWTFTEPEAKRLRDFLLKGGFLMVDDFHGTADWESFMRGMRNASSRTVPSRIWKTKMRSSTCSMISTIGFRCRGSSTLIREEHTKRTATCRSGEPSATTRAVSSLQFVTTCILVMRGNGRTVLSTRRISPPWLFVSDSTTSFME